MEFYVLHITDGDGGGGSSPYLPLAHAISIFELRNQNCLRKDGLGLAHFSEVAREAFADSGGVVADATARAVAALGVPVAAERVCARGALLEGAVRTAEARVAFAAVVVVRIPGIVVLGTYVRHSVRVGGRGTELLADKAVVSIVGVVVSELLEALARTMAGAVVRARTAAATLDADDSFVSKQF